MHGMPHLANQSLSINTLQGQFGDIRSGLLTAHAAGQGHARPVPRQAPAPAPVEQHSRWQGSDGVPGRHRSSAGGPVWLGADRAAERDQQGQKRPGGHAAVSEEHCGNRGGSGLRLQLQNGGTAAAAAGPASPPAQGGAGAAVRRSQGRRAAGWRGARVSATLSPEACLPACLFPHAAPRASSRASSLWTRRRRCSRYRAGHSIALRGKLSL